MTFTDFWRQLYLRPRFFQVFGGLAALLALGFWWAPLFVIARVLLGLATIATVAEIAMLYARGLRMRVRRRLPRVLSLGDETTVTLHLHNRGPYQLRLTVIDELPFQLQVRDLSFQLQLAPDEKRQLVYHIRPTLRGAYRFGTVNVFATTAWGLAERRLQYELPHELPVYPSIVQMKRYELYAFDRISHHHGIKRLRRIGHSYEFDQIKHYVRGDDYRSVNWKATGRRAELMVNQYEDERAQQIYCLIDKSRAMRLPFQGLSLMDHAINATLVLSNIALKKHDRAGLVTFSDVLGTALKADSRPIQLNKILQALYREQERPLDANFELLYYLSRKVISGRSLLMLFTNFESMYALERALPILRRINAFHLLVVVFFENTEIRDFVNQPARLTEDIYRQTVARKFLAEKSAMVARLRQFGIQGVLTRPEDLTINTINKYLELKAKGLI